MIYARLFICTILMTSSLNSMEIVKKHTQHSQSFKRYLLTQKICKKESFPKEIGYYIIHYYLALKNNHLLGLLKKEDLFMVAWDNVHIPINYYHLLTYIQIELIKEILSYRPPCVQYCHKCDKYKLDKRDYRLCEKDYFLESKKDYQLFLTLPIELRKCLAQAPKSLISWAIELQEDPRYNYKDIIIPKAINAFQVIQVKSESTVIKHDLLQKLGAPIKAHYPGYTPRLIVPEEKQLSLK